MSKAGYHIVFLDGNEISNRKDKSDARLSGANRHGQATSDRSRGVSKAWTACSGFSRHGGELRHSLLPPIALAEVYEKSYTLILHMGA